MRADTKTISIEAPPEKVLKFLADPENLPRWAVGFAKAIRREGDRWVVSTGGGDIVVRIDADGRTGVVDFWMSPAPGIQALAGSRVIPRGSGAEYVFTQFQAPGMPDDVFARSIQTLVHELTVLKALLEVECPLDPR
jgi:polyketide cyclase/dehydrase/lipid transport protein